MRRRGATNLRVRVAAAGPSDLAALVALLANLGGIVEVSVDVELDDTLDLLDGGDVLAVDLGSKLGRLTLLCIEGRGRGKKRTVSTGARAQKEGRRKREREN